MINKYFALLVLILILACNSKEKSTVNKKINHKAEIIITRSDDITNEAIRVRNFIKWYENNMNKLYSFNTIAGGPTMSENETPKNYFVNFDEVQKYLFELSTSEFFTKEFIAKEKQTFIDGDVYFKEHPENDGPPSGFDYDRFFMTQDDFGLDMKNLDKINFETKKIDKNNSEVQFVFPICGMRYKYVLKKEGLKWQIDKIENISNQQ